MLSLSQGVFLYTKTALAFLLIILFFCRVIYAQSWSSVFQCKKIARLPFGLQSYSFVEKYMLGLSQGVFLFTKMALAYRLTILFFVQKYMLSLSQGVFQYTKMALTFRFTTFFFCREIYAWCWPRCVLLYKNNATTFRMTILFFCREIYAQSQPIRVILH